jgi:hypothetical protein
MAGGPNAEFVACSVCLNEGVLTRAERVIEGVETDQYFCKKRHRFGLTFRKGPPSEPSWPPPQSVIDLVRSEKKKNGPVVGPFRRFFRMLLRQPPS